MHLPQKKKISLTCVLLTIFFLFHIFPPASIKAEQTGTDLRARKILEDVDDLWRSSSSSATITMQVKTRHYTRTVTMESWSKGKGKSLVRILTPLKEKGTSTLKSENNIYTYLPKTDRTIRLTSSMMMGSWMGSHFTNDDLVKESRLSDDYDPSITYEGNRDGTDIIEFTLIPKPDAPVVWGKIVTTVYAKDNIPIITKYYDEDMVLARTMSFTDIKSMGGRKVPAALRVVPTDKPDEYTEILYNDIQFDIDLNDAFFSLIRLRRK